MQHHFCTVAHRGSTKIYIAVQKYLLQYKNIYCSTKIFIPLQKYLLQYKNIYCSTKIFIAVQKYLLQYKNIFSLYKNIFLVQKYFSRTKIFCQYKNTFSHYNSPCGPPYFCASTRNFPSIFCSRLVARHRSLNSGRRRRCWLDDRARGLGLSSRNSRWSAFHLLATVHVV